MSAPARIPLSRPSITESEIALVNDAVRHGWGERCYDYIHQFEQAFAQHIGVRHAIATSSCTGALHMGLAALGVGPGDEVILADTNWVASVAPILYLGAKPILVDVLPDTWCLDPAAVRAALTPRTKAIMAVHLYGNLCAMDELLCLCEEKGIALIEDAAEAIGSIYHGQRAGAMGTFGAFSFHGSKTLSTGEGGMFVTDDTPLYKHVLSLSNHGRVAGQQRQFWPEMLGFKYKMSNLQAALGVGQLQRTGELVARKREIFHRYQKAFGNIEGVTMNPEPPGITIGAWMPTIVMAPQTEVSAEKMLQAFKLANIDARPFFAPLSTLPWMACSAHGAWAQDLYRRAVNLPSFHDMTEAEIDRVCNVVMRTILKKNISP